MPIYTSACPRNCYGTCSLLVHVTDGRVTGLEAHPGNLATPAGPCLKGLSYLEPDPARLLRPLRRRPDGGFRPVSWDEGLDLMAERLLDLRRRLGPRSVFYYAGSGSKGLLNGAGMAFWRLFGGCTTSYGDLCWPAGLEATRLTDTAREADLVLPAKSLFEQTDVIGAYWHPYLQVRQKVVDPPPEVKPETEIYWHLARRMGLPTGTLVGDGDAAVERYLEDRLRPFPGLSLERLREGPVLAPGAQEVAFADLVFPTPSGRVELWSDEAARRWGVDPLPGHRPPREAAVPDETGPLLQLLTPNNKNGIPLVAFTTTLSLLVALVAGGPRPLPRPWIMPGAGALCLALGACHLGRPGRAWRTLCNLRRSWLSREAALALAFLVLACLPQAPALRWAAAAAGFAALFAVDRVYQVAVRTSRLDFHSAHALFNGLYLTGLLAGYWPLALAAGALKAWLYLGRKAHFRSQGRPERVWLSLLRVGLGFVLPALAFGSGAAALGAVLGDLADRWEYYGELTFPSPGRQMARDLITFG